MPSLPKRIMEHASVLREATPICPAALLHLGRRAAVDQALARLARAGRLMRICQGVYMRPVETRFGPCAPRIGAAIEALSVLWGETIVPCGGSAANRLGLTTQNPVREVYLTSGRSRNLYFGQVTVELRHAPRWQLAAPRGKAGEVIRALAWLGPNEVEGGLEAILPGLSGTEVDELAARARSCPSDGGIDQRAPRACLRRRIRRFPPPTGAMPFALPKAAVRTARSCSRRTSGSSQRSTPCSMLRSATTSRSRAAHRCRRRTARSGDSPKISTSPTTSGPSPPIWSPMPATKRCRPHAARNAAGPGRSGPSRRMGPRRSGTVARDEASTRWIRAARQGRGGVPAHRL